MIVKVQIAVFIDGRIFTEHLEEELKGGMNIKGVLKYLDKIEKPVKNFSKRFLKQKPRPRILLNGKGIDPKRDLKVKLCDGDIVSLFSPIAGG